MKNKILTLVFSFLFLIMLTGCTTPANVLNASASYEKEMIEGTEQQVFITVQIENIDYMEEINTIYVGDEITLEVKFIDVLNENDLLGKIKWSTSDNSLATIDENGKLVATSDGKVIIYAEVEEVKKELEILIIKKNDFVYLIDFFKYYCLDGCPVPF